MTQAHIEAARRYAARNPEKVRAAKRKWNKSESGRKTRTAWQRSDEGRAWYRSEYKRLRQSVVAGYGAQCACCRESEPKFLAIDHVHGGGSQDRKRRPSGIQFFNDIIKAGFPGDYQILCHNCNVAKGLYGVCPHQAARAKQEDDSTASFTATLTTDASAEPITAIDPAGP